MTCCVVFGILVSAELSTLETGSAVDSKRRKINDDHDDDNHNHVPMLQLDQRSNKYASVVGFLRHGHWAISPNLMMMITLQIQVYRQWTLPHDITY